MTTTTRVTHVPMIFFYQKTLEAIRFFSQTKKKSDLVQELCQLGK